MGSRTSKSGPAPGQKELTTEYWVETLAAKIALALREEADTLMLAAQNGAPSCRLTVVLPKSDILDWGATSVGPRAYDKLADALSQSSGKFMAVNSTIQGSEYVFQVLVIM